MFFLLRPLRPLWFAGGSSLETSIFSNALIRTKSVHQAGALQARAGRPTSGIVWICARANFKCIDYIYDKTTWKINIFAFAHTTPVVTHPQTLHFTICTSQFALSGTRNGHWSRAGLIERSAAIHSAAQTPVHQEVQRQPQLCGPHCQRAGSIEFCSPLAAPAHI